MTTMGTNNAREFKGVFAWRSCRANTSSKNIKAPFKTRRRRRIRPSKSVLVVVFLLFFIIYQRVKSSAMITPPTSTSTTTATPATALSKLVVRQPFQKPQQSVRKTRHQRHDAAEAKPNSLFRVISKHVLLHRRKSKVGEQGPRG